MRLFNNYCTMLFYVVLVSLVGLKSPYASYFNFNTIHSFEEIFQNMTEDYAPCCSLSTCENSEKELIKRCFCDSYCAFFNDCCIDFINYSVANGTISPTKTQPSFSMTTDLSESSYKIVQKSPLTTDTYNFSDYINSNEWENNDPQNDNKDTISEAFAGSESTTNKTWYSHAEKWRPFLSCDLPDKTKISAGAVTVNRCPSQEESNIQSSSMFETYKSLCETKTVLFTGIFYYVTIFLPFTDEYGIVFRNMYCALCHGVHMTKMTPWKMYIITEWCGGLSGIPANASLTQKLSVMLLERKCPFHFVAPSHSILRPCYNGDVTSANNRAEDLCRRFNAPVEIISSSRRSTDFQLWKNIFCWASSSSPGDETTYESCPKEVSCEYLKESLTQDYKKDGGTALMLMYNPSVPTNFPEPPDDKAVKCAAGFVSHQHACTQLEEVRNALISIDVVFNAYSSTPASVIKRAIETFTSMIQRMNTVVEIKDDIFNTTQGTWDYDLKLCLHINFRIYVRILGWLSMVRIVQYENWLNQFNFRYDEEDMFAWDFFTIVRETAEIDYKLPKCTLTDEGLSQMELIQKNTTKDAFNVSAIDYFLRSSTKNKDYVTNCPGLRIHTIQYLSMANTIFFELIAWNCTYDILPERTVKLVSSFLAKKFLFSCSGFAVFSLFFALFFNIPNFEFKSLPGFNLANTLVMSIMALTGLFLCPIAEEFTYSWIALEQAVTFFWVATFSWGTLSAFHLWFLFAKVMKNPKSDPYYSRILSKIYLLIGYVFPVFILIIKLSLDPSCCKVNRDYMDGGLNCMPGGIFSIMSFPFFVFVTLSTLFLCLTIVHIHNFKNDFEMNSFLVFYWVQVGLTIGIVVMWATNLLAQQWHSLVIWETFLILSVIYGLEINTIFIVSKRTLITQGSTGHGSLKW